MHVLQTSGILWKDPEPWKLIRWKFIGNSLEMATETNFQLSFQGSKSARFHAHSVYRNRYARVVCKRTTKYSSDNVILSRIVIEMTYCAIKQLYIQSHNNNKWRTRKTDPRNPACCESGDALFPLSSVGSEFNFSRIDNKMLCDRERVITCWRIV